MTQNRSWRYRLFGPPEWQSRSDTFPESHRCRWSRSAWPCW
jgi:hypothetical protein